MKPENILVKNAETYEVCIADLGLACNADDHDNKTYKCGSPGYIAPEILKGTSYDLNVDTFSLGSIFYSLITRKNIFDAINSKQILLRNQYACPQDIIKKDNLKLSSEGLCLLNQML